MTHTTTTSNSDNTGSGNTKYETANTPTFTDRWLIFIALFAFVAASYLFLGTGCPQKGKYQDWGMHIKKGVVQLLQDEKTQTEASLKNIAAINTSVEAQKFLNKKLSDTLTDRLLQINAELLRLELGWNNVRDTIPPAFQKNIFFKANQVDSSLASFDTKAVSFYYRISDTTKLVKNILLASQLQASRNDQHTSHIELFKKYPETGFWSILSIAQLVFWAVIICVSMSLIVNLVVDLKTKGIITQKGTISNAAFSTAIAIVVFVLTFMFIIYDEPFRFEDIFFSDFKLRMFIYGGIGYTTAGVLLFSFFLMTYYVRIIKTQYGYSVKKYNYLIGSIQEKNRLEQVTQPTSGEPPAQPTDTSDVIQLKEQAEKQAQDLATFKEQYKICKRYFDFFFAMAAVVLSVLVVWLGSLFSAINSMDLFAFFQRLTSHSYLPYDFVYLYGALHTLLLFIFYVPVKLRLINLSFSIPEEATAINSDGFKTTFKNIFLRIIEILAASSPLLTAILSKALE